MVAVVKPRRPRIRRMCRDDLNQVARIESEAYSFGWSIGVFRDCLRARYTCWVLERDVHLLGYGVLSAGAGEAHILNICVAPAEQGNGHGRRLLGSLLDSACWYGAERVFLEVRPSNRIARRLYTSVGFHEIGRRSSYYPALEGREDAIVMALERPSGWTHHH